MTLSSLRDQPHVRHSQPGYLALILLSALLFAASPPARAQSSSTVQLQGRWDNLSRDRGYAGVWGYAAPDGREYALVGTNTGLAIVEVTDPANPTEVSFIPGRSSIWREAQTYGTYAYVTTEAGGGVQIIDLSDLPNRAVLANTYTARVDNAHTISIDQQRGYAFVNGATRPPSNSKGGQVILDLYVDPVNPVEIGVYDLNYVHDAYVRDGVVYASELNNGFSVIDTSDPLNPLVLARKRYPGNFTHNGWLTDDGGYFLTTDEIVTGGHLRVWDIRDLENIQQVGEYATHPDATIHNVFALGDFAYASYYAEGLRVIDITDPTLPVEAGYYDTHPEWITGERGAWGCYPFLPSGTILISDIETGLWTFTFDGTHAGRLRGVVRDSVTGNPLPNTTLRLKGSNTPQITDANGQYGIGYLPGDYKLTVTAIGYTPAEIDITLTSGATDTLDISLTRQ